MDQNDDYPQDEPTQDPPTLPEPILDCCVITTNRVHFRDGSIEICTDKIIVKNGQSAPFNRAGNLIDENDDDSVDSSSDEIQCVEEDSRYYSKHQNEIAYLIDEDIRDAIYGKVFRGTVLRRSNENDMWTETDEKCAIKEMPWERIKIGIQNNYMENPQDEIAVMQHLLRVYNDQFDGQQQVSGTDAMRRARIVMPLDFLYDHQNLYTITPYCAGGELLDLVNDRLATRGNFTEEESKVLFSSILDGVEWLQRAGLTHKDISLENIMVDENDMAVIIDLGMCLQIPFLDDGQRCLINSRPPCGKIKYMAPELYNMEPFDGHAVDMWAVGVCLFIMLTGHTPWDRPSPLDRNFRNFTGGYLTQILTHDWPVRYNVNLSADAIDLLQRMLFLDPRDRLSLQQVRRHPWMV